MYQPLNNSSRPLLSRPSPTLKGRETNRHTVSAKPGPGCLRDNEWFITSVESGKINSSHGQRSMKCHYNNRLTLRGGQFCISGCLASIKWANGKIASSNKHLFKRLALSLTLFSRARHEEKKNESKDLLNSVHLNPRKNITKITGSGKYCNNCKY